MNELKHMSEFRSVLAQYQLSASAKKTLVQAQLALLVGPTSSGRNTILIELLKTGAYHHIVSDTTREIRIKDDVPVERDGREYWFRSEEEVLADLKKGEYIEAAIIHNQQVSGCNVRELEAATRSQKIAIKDITETGAETIHKLKPETKVIFVTPPDFVTWQSRLHARVELPKEEIRRRFESVCREIKAALENDYYSFVVNDRLEDAVADVDAIVQQNKLDSEKQKSARKLAEQLYEATQNHLKQMI